MRLYKLIINNLVMLRDFLSIRFRQKRFELFRHMVEFMPKPLEILDIGGTLDFWEKMHYSDIKDIHITLFNIRDLEISRPGFKCMVGDARCMQQFEDKQLDIAFSNSVIEHLFDFESQQRMAKEVMRVGKSYFVQTPNRHFPLEPHFLIPFFQYLPLRFRIWLVLKFKLGWQDFETVEENVDFVKGIRLLTKKDMQLLFPGAKIHTEKFLGLTKSFVAYDSLTDQQESMR